MSNRFNPHDTRDAALLRNDLHRVLRQGVRLSFIAQQAGIARQTLSGINSGRTQRVAVGLQGLVLETILRIEEGRIEVPESARRPKGLAPVLAQGKHGQACGYGHPRTPESTRIVNGKKICKPCETRRRKQYEMRLLTRERSSS